MKNRKNGILYYFTDEFQSSDIFSTDFTIFRTYEYPLL